MKLHTNDNTSNNNDLTKVDFFLCTFFAYTQMYSSSVTY